MRYSLTHKTITVMNSKIYAAQSP